MQKKIGVFFDTAQRTILGEFVSETDTTITYKNLAMLNIATTNGSVSIQLIPVFFNEIKGDRSATTFFTYQKAGITLVSFEGGFDVRAASMYDNIFNPPTIDQPVPVQTEETKQVKVVDLWGDQK